MQPEPTTTRPPNPWRKRIIRFLAGFAITLVVGKVIELVTAAETIEAAYAAQENWIAAVSGMSPFSLAGTYFSALKDAWQGPPPDPEHYDINRASGAGILSPLFAFFHLLGRIWNAGQIAVLIQLALGILCVVTFNYVRTRGETLFFNAEPNLMDFVFMPLAAVAAASVIAFGLQVYMLGALLLLQWLTGLAGAAAGATGVAGVGWYCLTKLAEKGTEMGAEHKFLPHR